jgi:hypothetical protein
VGRETPPRPAGGPPTGGGGGGGSGAGDGGRGGAGGSDGGGRSDLGEIDDLDDLSPEERDELAARLDELRSQLVSTPAEVVVANHAYGLFELAATHLSQQPPNLDQARLAVDALGAIVGALAGRLGDAEPSLNDALAQIRLTYVQISEMMKNVPADGAPGSS